MSSREIAELTGKQHKDVLRDIRSMLDGLCTERSFALSEYQDATGRSLPCYRLPKRETLILVSGYSVELRARIIDRWQELEAHGPAVPQTFAAALRLAADQQEQIAQLAHENQQQADKIDVLEGLLAKGVSAPEFCRHLNGVNTQAVNRWLQTKGWLFEGAGQYCSWKVTSYARDRYMTERAFEVAGSQGPFSVSKPVLLRKGASWLIDQYMRGKLPMKKSWPGSYTHDLGDIQGVAA